MPSYYENGKNVGGKESDKRYEYNPSTDKWIEIGPATNGSSRDSNSVLFGYELKAEQAKRREEIELRERNRTEREKRELEAAKIQQQIESNAKFDARIAARQRYKNQSPFYRFVQRVVHKAPTQINMNNMNVEEISNLYQGKSGRSR